MEQRLQVLFFFGEFIMMKKISVLAVLLASFPFGSYADDAKETTTEKTPIVDEAKPEVDVSSDKTKEIVKDEKKSEEKVNKEEKSEMKDEDKAVKTDDVANEEKTEEDKSVDKEKSEEDSK